MPSFDVGTAVMGSQASELLLTLGAEVAGSIQRMEARAAERRGVADVVQPSGGYELVGHARGQYRGRIRRLRGRRRGVPPSATTNSEQLAGEVAGDRGIEHETSVGTASR